MKIKPNKAKHRKAIALDVIAQIKAHQYNVETGTYAIFGGYRSIPETGDLRTALKKIVTARRPCIVCGLGACFLSLVRLYDDVKIEEAVDGGSIPASVINRELGKFFSLSERSVIEAVFEVKGAFLRGSRAEAQATEFAGAMLFRDMLGAMGEEDRLLWLMNSVANLSDTTITITTLRKQLFLALANDLPAVRAALAFVPI